jgi:hypothetical protein
MSTNQPYDSPQMIGKPNGQQHVHMGEPKPSSFWKSKTPLVVAGFLLVAGFFLFSEHRAHALGILPYLIILACPLLHIFMHGGHGGHSGHGKHGKHESGPTQPSGRAEP